MTIALAFIVGVVIGIALLPAIEWLAHRYLDD